MCTHNSAFSGAKLQKKSECVCVCVTTAQLRRRASNTPNNNSRTKTTTIARQALQHECICKFHSTMAAAERSVRVFNLLASPCARAASKKTTLDTRQQHSSPRNTTHYALGNRDTILGDFWRAPRLLDDDVATFGAERHHYGVGQLVHADQHTRTRI
jgi:hypothetical protein